MDPPQAYAIASASIRMTQPMDLFSSAMLRNLNGTGNRARTGQPRHINVPRPVAVKVNVLTPKSRNLGLLTNGNRESLNQSSQSRSESRLGRERLS
jgi:hypothetical protein